MSIHADRIYNSYRKYMSSIDNPSPIRKKLLIEGKIIEKKIGQQHQQKIPYSTMRSAMISGKSITIQPKRSIQYSNRLTNQSVPLSIQSSRINSSLNGRIKSQIIPMKQSKIRCKSAYSKLQQLKNQKQTVKPDKIFSSVNLLLDRKNSMRRSQPTQFLQQMGKLKVHGFSPFPSELTLF